MTKKKRSTKKKRGRPATGQDPVTAIRLSPDMLSTLDLWRPVYPDARSRSDFIRYMIADGLHAAVRRQKRRAAFQEPRLTAEGAFTAERERDYTKAIKTRMLYEGACTLPWSEYFAWRKKHDGCEPLNEADLAYAGAYSSCPVPKAKSRRAKYDKAR